MTRAGINIRKILKHLSGKHLLFTIFFIMFGVIVPAYYLSTRLYPDEATLLVMGDLIRNGSVLYRDIIDFKMPGGYYLPAFIFCITGKSFVAARILTYIVNAVSAILIFFIGARIKNKNIGMIGSIFFLIGTYSYMSGGYFFMAEPYAVFFIIISILFFLKGGIRSNFIAGLALGIGILFKQTVILAFVVFIIYYYFHLWFQKNRTKEYLTNSFKNLSLILIGCMLPLLLTFAYFYLMGAADEMLYYTVFFISDYPIKPNFTEWAINFFSYLPFLLLSISMLLFVGYKFLKEKILDDKHLFLILWLIIFFLPTVAIFRFGVRILFIVPPISLIIALFLLKLHQDFKERRVSKELKSFIVATLIITSSITIGTNISQVLNLKGDVNDQIQAVQEIEQYVAGEVYVFPTFNWVYFFYNLTPGISCLSTITSEKIAECVINDLQNNNISYVVAIKGYYTNIFNKSKEVEATGTSRFQNMVFEYIIEKYEILITTDHFTIYKIK